MGDRRPKTCFISAPVGVDTTPLKEELSRRAVASLDQSSLLAGSHVHETLANTIADVDFVCGVIPNERAIANVLVELGMAIGANRPLLLFVSPKAELPMALRGHPYLRASLNDAEAMRFHLDAFLKNVGKSRNGRELVRPTGRVAADPAALHLALDQVARWEQETVPPHERELIDFLARVFEASGSVASTASPSSVQRFRKADLAVWIDELEEALENPLLIEVVRRAPVRPGTITRFRRLLVESRSLVGLIVVWHDGTPINRPADDHWPMIIEMGVRDLVETLGRGDVARAILQWRNVAVHAAS